MLKTEPSFEGNHAFVDTQIPADLKTFIKSPLRCLNHISNFEKWIIIFPASRGCSRGISAVEITTEVFKSLNCHDSRDPCVVEAPIFTPIHPQLWLLFNSKDDLDCEESSHLIDVRVIPAAIWNSHDALLGIAISFLDKNSEESNREHEPKKVKRTCMRSKIVPRPSVLREILDDDVSSLWTPVTIFSIECRCSICRNSSVSRLSGCGSNFSTIVIRLNILSNEKIKKDSQLT